MNWETGYGDWVASPVWGSMRVLPWMEKTALVLGAQGDRAGQPVRLGLRADPVEVMGRRAVGEQPQQFEGPVLRHDRRAYRAAAARSG
jgi:hypothetical protein